jgi:hypothetical protein
MAFNINDFLSNMQGDGARPNLFEIFFDPAGTGNLISLRAQATALPASTIGVAPAFYFGRMAKFAGNRIFGDWSVNILVDEDDFINGPRAFLERWSNRLNRHVQNNREVGWTNPGVYQMDGRVRQYSKDGSRVIAEYEMKGCFPTAIGEMPVAWNANDTIATFNVTFAMQWWQRLATTDAA